MTPEQVFQALLENTGFSVVFLVLGIAVLAAGKIFETFSGITTDRAGRSLIGGVIILVLGVFGFLYLSPSFIDLDFNLPITVASAALLIFSGMFFDHSVDLFWTLNPDSYLLKYLDNPVIPVVTIISSFLLFGTALVSYSIETWAVVGLFASLTSLAQIAALSLNFGSGRLWVEVELEGEKSEEGLLLTKGSKFLIIQNREGNEMTLNIEKIISTEQTEIPSEFKVEESSVPKIVWRKINLKLSRIKQKLNRS